MPMMLAGQAISATGSHWCQTERAYCPGSSPVQFVAVLYVSVWVPR